MTPEERLRQQYLTSLGRPASDDDIRKWTSGQYGGGGIEQWLGQIGSSHEAQQRPGYRAPLANLAAPGAGYGATPTTRTTQPTSSTQSYNRQEPAATAGTDPWETFKNESWGSGTYDWSRQSFEDTLKKAYKRFTGRDADAAGLAAHLSNPNGLEGAVRAIYDSDEAKAYGQANPDAFRGRAVTAPPDPNAPAAAAAVTPQIFQGFQPKYAMEGFDFQREQNTGKSAKDAFAYLSNNAPPPPINDKAALGQWFQQYVAPGMNALGHKILSVEGDKFTFENWQGRFTVDFGRGAGAEGGALAWQVDENTAQMANGAYVPQQGAASPVAPVTPVTPVVPPVTEQTDSTVPPTSHAYAAPLSDTVNYRRRPYQRFAGTGTREYSAPQPSI